MSEAEAWKQFWTGRAAGSEHRYRDPALAAVIASHWHAYFEHRFAGAGRVNLIDLACGEGEVLRFAQRGAGAGEGTDLNAFCTDIAPDAVTLAAQGVPGLPAAAAVADSARLPFADAAFDCAVSQYGLEYAGPDAFGEAGRVVGGGGSFHALVHCEGGVVEQSCSAVADLLATLHDSALFDALSRYASCIPRAVRGEAPEAEAQACVAALRTALERVEAAAREASPGPARDHVARLVADCRTLANRLGAYAPEDVAGWIAVQKAEADAFLHRMTSMLRVAQSEAQIRDIRARLEAGGLTVAEIATLDAPQGDRPLAWVLDARRETGG